MKRGKSIFACMMLALTIWASAQTRNWQTGTLVESEQTKVRDGSTKNTMRDNSDSSSQHSTTTTTDNYDTYQVFTIEAEGKKYVARQRLFFPWSKPALATVGEPVKFAVEKNNLFILGDDGKQYKTGVVKVSMKAAQ